MRILYDTCLSLLLKQETTGNNATSFPFRYGKIYFKAAKNSLVKGSDYAKNEIQRVERLLEKVIFSFSQQKP